MIESVKEAINITEDGKVTKIILEEGHGPIPTKGQEVEVTYKGTLMDGTEFDSSLDKEDPFSFTLGEGSVIKAWEEGIATMKKGEKAILICHPEYAYGEDGSPPKIPPNATLKFEIELIDSIDPVKTKWDYSDEERVKLAEQFKQEGNQHLKDKDFDKAIKQYEEAIDYCTIAQPNQETAKITHACHLNMSLAYIKQKSYTQAIESATKGLELSQNDIKGYYRRAMAYLQNDQFTQAKEDLEKALVIDNTNQDILAAIAKVNAEVQRLAKKEKSQWKNLFSQDYYEEPQESKWMQGKIVQ